MIFIWVSNYCCHHCTLGKGRIGLPISCKKNKPLKSQPVISYWVWFLLNKVIETPVSRGMLMFSTSFFLYMHTQEFTAGSLLYFVHLVTQIVTLTLTHIHSNIKVPSSSMSLGIMQTPQFQQPPNCSLVLFFDFYYLSIYLAISITVFSLTMLTDWISHKAISLFESYYQTSLIQASLL